MRKRFFRIGLLCLLLFILLRYGCPFYRLTHIPCPCCGVTRAWLAFLHGDLAMALRYHALFPLVPAIVAVYIFWDRLPRTKSADVCLFSFAGVLFLYGVLRWLGVVIIP